MMYHPIKFGCKKISSSADMVETVTFDQMSPHCDLHLEDSKPIFLHDTLAHNVAWPLPSLVTEDSAAAEWSSRWTFIRILNLFCDLDLDHNTAIQSFHETIHLMMMYHHTKFSCKRISSSDNILKKSYFDYIILNCDLDLEDSKPIFLKDNLAHNDASP